MIVTITHDRCVIIMVTVVNIIYTILAVVDMRFPSRAEKSVQEYWSATRSEIRVEIVVTVPVI